MQALRFPAPNLHWKSTALNRSCDHDDLRARARWEPARGPSAAKEGLGPVIQGDSPVAKAQTEARWFHVPMEVIRVCPSRFPPHGLFDRTVDSRAES